MARNTIYVRFSKNGFYHPAFGTMGHADEDKGRVYELPEFFSAEGMLPKSAKIIEKKVHQEAVENDEDDPAVRPKNVDPEELKKAQERAAAASKEAETKASAK